MAKNGRVPEAKRTRIVELLLFLLLLNSMMGLQLLRVGRRT
jgi:hypothetical protein